MAYIYTLLVISVLGLICYRMIKKKSTPSNLYTPYDEITMGSKIDVKQVNQLEDTKHIVKYEEKTKN